MNTQNKQKREYRIPVMEQIRLDNEISLALESTPPWGPLESILNTSETISNEPVLSNLL